MFNPHLKTPTLNQVASGMSAGSPSEDCLVPGLAGCNRQNLSFIVEGQSDSLLFTIPPSIDAATGELLLAPGADTSGMSSLTVTLLDDGALNTNATPGCVRRADTAWGGRSGNGANAPCLIGARADGTVGRAAAAPVTVWVQVVPGAPETNVRLLYDVDCGNATTQACACRPMTDAPHLTIRYLSYNETLYSERTGEFNASVQVNQTVIVNVTVYKLVDNSYNFSNISDASYFLDDAQNATNGTNATDATNATGPTWVSQTIGGIYIIPNFTNVSEILPLAITTEVTVLVPDSFNVTDAFVVERTVPASTLNPQPSTLNPQPSTLNPQPSTLNLQPSTLNLQPSSLNPQPSTLNPQP